jgi:carbamoyl-phosphate synthase large subunit
MKTILVTGASGIVGYGVLRSLKNSALKIKLIGSTIYNDSVAQGFCDVFELAPLTSDPDYVNWLKLIIRKHNIDLIIPGIEADMYKWVENIPELEEAGTKLLLNKTDLISLCSDKWVFYESFIKENTPYSIDTTLNSDYYHLVNEFGLPFILKPRRGFGSKGIIIVDSIEKFSKYKDDVGAILMAQRIVGNIDEEFTTSAFCDGTGGYFAIMTLRRKLSKEGFTEKAEVIGMSDIADAVSKLCKIFKPIGPTNFQFRKDKGLLKLLEINPRISSSTSIRTAFGYNESKMSVEYFLENKFIKQPEIKKGKAVRYVEDFIFYD